MKHALYGYTVVVSFAALLVWCLILEGCAHVPDILRAMGAGASWLGSVLDGADDGQEVFFDRHPMQRSNAEAVADKLLDTRYSLAECKAAIVAAERGEASDPVKACKEPAKDYAELYELLKATGVLDGKCRDCGGAEADSPEPKPLPLPAPDLVAARMGSE